MGSSALALISYHSIIQIHLTAASVPDVRHRNSHGNEGNNSAFSRISVEAMRVQSD